jgi:hypothetical protein
MMSTSSMKNINLGKDLPLRHNTISLSTSGQLGCNNIPKIENCNFNNSIDNKEDVPKVVNYKKPILKTQMPNLNKSIVKKEPHLNEEEIIYEKKPLLRFNNSLKNNFKKDLNQSFDAYSNLDNVSNKSSGKLHNDLNNSTILKSTNTNNNYMPSISENLDINKKRLTAQINFNSNCSTNCNSNNCNNIETEKKDNSNNLDNVNKYYVPKNNINLNKNNSIIKNIAEKAYDLDLKSVSSIGSNFKRYVTSSSNNLNKTFYK